jgi:hypothetical protein
MLVHGLRRQAGTVAPDLVEQIEVGTQLDAARF